MADFASLTPDQQAQVLKLAMSGKAQTPGNQSRAKQLLLNEPGFQAAMLQRAGFGGRETSVGPATIDHFKGQLDETDPSQTAGQGPAKGNMGMPKRMGANADKSASNKSAENEPSIQARANDAKKSSLETAVADGNGDADLDDSGGISAGAAAAGLGAAVAVIGGVKYLLDKSGKPIGVVNDRPPPGVAAAASPNGPVDPNSGNGRDVGLRNPTEASIAATVDRNDGPIDADYTEVRPDMIEGGGVPAGAAMLPPPDLPQGDMSVGPPQMGGPGGPQLERPPLDPREAMMMRGKMGMSTLRDAMIDDVARKAATGAVRSIR